MPVLKGLDDSEIGQYLDIAKEDALREFIKLKKDSMPDSFV